jgi:CAAX protease family protein
MPSQPVFVRAVPFGIYIAFLPLLHLLVQLGFGGDLRWLYGLQVACVALMLAANWRRYEELTIAPTAVGAAKAILVGLAVFLLWISLDLPGLRFGSASGFDPREPTGEIDFVLASLRLAGAAIVVPVMEELFWRSLVMRWIDVQDFRRHAPNEVSLKAILLSSVLFATEHVLWGAGLIAGLAYAWLYRRSGNLWVPIFAHASTNAALGIWVLMTANWEFW